MSRTSRPKSPKAWPEEVKSDRGAETPQAPTTPEAWDEEDGKSNTSAEGIEGPQEP